MVISIQKHFIFILSGVLLLWVAGCSSSAGNSADDWPKGVSIGSSTIGGTFHVLMTGWGDILNEELGVQANVEVTGGPVNNVQLVQNKETDFGPVTMGIAVEGYTGTGWADEAYEDVRMVWPMYQSYLHWWVMPEHGIESIYDFEGEIIAHGPAGSSPTLYGERIMELLGIEPARTVTGQNSDLANQMRDGQTVGMAGFSGLPNPTADEMVTTDNVTVLGVPEDEVDLVVDTYGGIHPAVIPANYYNNEEDIHTIGVWSAVLTHKDHSEDFIYELTKVTFENNEKLVDAHRAAEEALLENVPELEGVPFHIGAIKYFEEQGVELPDSAYPPEYNQ